MVDRLRLALLAVTALFTVTATGAAAQPLGPPAATPPMGWSTWYGLRCDFVEADIREMADRIAANGLKAAGYDHLNIDDCWVTGRAPDGALVVDAKRFPGGVKAIGDYIHAKGLKFGLYTSAGTTTCQRELQADGGRLKVGSRGHEAQDMRQFAAWGADFVKVDWCGRYDTQDSRSSYETFRDAIAATGRPMLLSICEWGYGKPWLWARGVGQMWRIAMDSLNCWACTADWGAIGVVHTFDKLAEVAASGGTGGWNDPDNLMIGNGVLSPDEERAQMSIYAAAAAPLIIAADLRTIRPASLAVLTNRAVIAVNQDPLGKPGRRVRQEDGEEVWVRELSGGRRAIVLFNRNAEPRRIKLNWMELDLTPGTRLGAGRELWSGEAVPEAESVARRVAGHGAALLVVGPAKGGSEIRAPI